MTFLLVLTLLNQAGDSLPEDMRELLESRRINNAVFVWHMYFDVESRMPDLRARLEQDGWENLDEVLKRSRYYTCKYAGPDALYVDYGDEEGCQNPHLKGGPGAYGTQRVLVTPEDTWGLMTSIPFVKSLSVTGQLGSGMQDHPDIRTFGLLSVLGQEETLERIEAAIRSVEPGSWKVEASGHTREVTATWHNRDGGAVQYHWRFDLDRGHSLTRMSARSPSGMLTEAILEPAQWGETWFPSRITYRKDGQLCADIEVFHAEFGTLTQERLGLNELELPVGMQLDSPPEPRGTIENPMFDGTRFVPMREFLDRCRSGELSLAEQRAWFEPLDASGQGAVPWELNRSPFDLVRAPYRPGLWEPYVRWFIRKHKLEGEKAKKAWDILGECQKQAYTFMEDHKDDMAKLDEKVASVRSEATGELRDERLKDLEGLREKLLAPIDGIFHKQLVPRLEILVR